MLDYTQTTRILILDDHGLFRESLARLLSAEPDFQVIGQYGTTKEASAVIRDDQVDLLLLDFDLGSEDCTEFVRSALQGGFKGKILLVTAGVNASQSAELVRLGVGGIFLKHDLPTQLTEAIRDVARGKVWLDQVVLKDTFTGSGAMRAPATFTTRERQVLKCIFEGLTNKEIAESLGTSEGSIKASIQQLFSKTGVRTRSQLVRVALERHKDLC